MRCFRLYLILILFSSFCASNLYANGTYYIGKDDGGIYFQTDNHGGWYIDQDDLKYFSIGETGTYFIEKDQEGTYLETDNLYKFYLDLDAMEKLEQEVSEFNRYYEQKIEQERAEKARKEEIEAQKELAEIQKEMEAQRRARESSAETYIITTRTKSDYGPIGVEEQIKNHFSNLKRRLRSGPTRGGSFTPSYSQSRETRNDYIYQPPMHHEPMINRRSSGAINPYTGEYYPPTGDGGLIRPSTGTIYAPAGPHGVINTETGEFIPVTP